MLFRIVDYKEHGYRLVLNATSGSLKGDTLTLNGVPNVIYYSDRQPTKAGHISVAEFIKTWNKWGDSFKADPPNATLSVLKKKETKSVLFDLKLRTVQQKRGSVVFKVVVLEGMLTESLENSSVMEEEVMEEEIGLVFHTIRWCTLEDRCER